ncbi:YlcI/YnfO family protein [Variovorax sp. J22R115]|uniref:YlcI/YnfO family protein n=1 Tax=Variovorax sp. J22R115 TaxID=3053509 RepID=UPI002578378B|nr:YlcI/YnfO family protein [Variovorax sp. J22R115]MDM0050624.1 YlcI/YnfO family protein [Variovorax sp. J22R115]
MKTATIPSVRVEPELREEVEQLLGEGESLSEFVEAAVRVAVRQRQNQAEFVARGLRSLSRARQTGGYVEADEVLRKLDSKLRATKARKSATHS